jgi:hypothetical protein
MMLTLSKIRTSKFNEGFQESVLILTSGSRESDETNSNIVHLLNQRTSAPRPVVKYNMPLAYLRILLTSKSSYNSLIAVDANR